MDRLDKHPGARLTALMKKIDMNCDARTPVVAMTNSFLS
jgi:hypothetical protein